MSINTHGVWRLALGPPPALTVFGPSRHCGESDHLSWVYLQRVHGSHTWRPHITNHLQCGSKRGHPPLVDRSSSGGIRTGWVWEGGWKDDKLFYVEDGLLAYTKVESLQWAFNMLNDLCNQVGIRTKVGKMVSMVC